MTLDKESLWWVFDRIYAKPTNQKKDSLALHDIWFFFADSFYKQQDKKIIKEINFELRDVFNRWTNLFLDRRGGWDCCWRSWSRWPLKTKTEEEEEVDGGKTLTLSGGFWSCDSWSTCSCFIKILGDGDETVGGGSRGGGDQVVVVVTGKKGLQESCSSLQEEEEEGSLLSLSPWMCVNRGGGGGGSCSCLQFPLLSSWPAQELVVETEELQLLTTAKRSQSSEDMVILNSWVFRKAYLLFDYVGERKREREGDKLWRKGRRWLFLCRKRERERVWRDWGSVRERNRWLGERALDLLFVPIIYTFDKKRKKKINFWWVFISSFLPSFSHIFILFKNHIMMYSIIVYLLIFERVPIRFGN